MVHNYCYFYSNVFHSVLGERMSNHDLRYLRSNGVEELYRKSQCILNIDVMLSIGLSIYLKQGLP